MCYGTVISASVCLSLLIDNALHEKGSDYACTFILPYGCNYSNGRGVVRLGHTWELTSFAHHQQHNILPKNSHGSWCLESMHFTIQATMKPQTKCIANKI